jgi:hypothetical protein
VGEEVGIGEGARVGDGTATTVGVDVETAGAEVGEATCRARVLSGEGLTISITGVGEACAGQKGSRGPQVVMKVLKSRKKPATNPASTVPIQPHISLPARPLDLPS